MDREAFNESNRIFIESWKVAGPMLEQVRYRELRAQTEQRRAAAADDLFQIGAELARPRKTSGLIELQKILQKQRP